MPKRHFSPLVSGRVRLRLLEEADLPMTRAWRNQDHIRKWFFNSGVITPEQHQGWWTRYQDRDDDFVFIIEETETLKRAVGQVAIYNVDWAARRAEFGRLMIGEPDAQGQGLALLATSTIVDEALITWGINEVYLEVLSDNAAALAIYHRCGFRELGRHDGVVKMEKRKL
jgi:RimJ/RimL family protein N-acetyltransferase